MNISMWALLIAVAGIIVAAIISDGLPWYKQGYTRYKNGYLAIIKWLIARYS